MIIRGYDTETYKGNVKLLACSDGSYIETNEAEKLLDFLSGKGKGSDYNVFYNVAFDFSAIMKDFLLKNTQKMREQFKAGQRSDYFVGKYHVKSIDTKGFVLKREDESVYFFDAANFYTTAKGYLTLEYAASQYLGEHKSDAELKLDRERIGKEAGYYESHREDVIKYCIQDCRLTARLCEKTIQGLKSLGLPIPEKLWSMATVHKELMKQKNIKNPFKKFHGVLQRFVRETYFGGIFQTDYRGRYKDIIDLDINSAYPTEMMRLEEPDGYFFHMTDSGFKDCFYKFYLIKIFLNPIVQFREKKRIHYVYSNEPKMKFCTQFDLDVYDRYGLNYEIVDGYGFTTNGKRPFDYLKGFYQRKADIKKTLGDGSVEYHLIKIFLNSGYGVEAQSKPHVTPFTNFIYASYITAYCRKVILNLKFDVEKNGLGNVLSINTDGLLIERIHSDLKVKLEELGWVFDSKLGNIDYKCFDSVVIFENGVYILYQDGKEPVFKKRGYKYLSVRDLETASSHDIQIKHNKITKLKEGVIQQKMESIADFLDIKKEFATFWADTNPEGDYKVMSQTDYPFISQFFTQCFKLIRKVI
jgi:hypothetical protein